MLLKRLLGDRRIILGANSEDDTPLLELQRVTLQHEMGFALRAAGAEHDAVHTIVADDSAPQGVVEIAHQALPGSSALRRYDAGEELSVQRPGLESDFLLRLQPAPDVEPGLDAVALHLGSDVEQRYPVLLRRLGNQIVQAGNE